MQKKYLILIIVGAIVLLAAAFWGYRQYQRRGAPDLTQAQKDVLARQITKAEGEIAGQDDNTAYFGYLDKADALRQRGEYSQALAVLQDAYKRKATWQGTSSFILIEARIAAQRDTNEGIAKYEALLKKFPAENADYYREYANFLKFHDQDKQKIARVYYIGANALKDSALYKEYRDYVADNHLPE